MVNIAAIEWLESLEGDERWIYFRPETCSSGAFGDLKRDHECQSSFYPDYCEYGYGDRLEVIE